jgi:hypothetical protein
MRSTKTSRLLLGAAIAAIATVATGPAATAASGDAINGGCFFNTVGGASVDGNNVGDPNQQNGVIGDVSVTQDGSGAPTGATVSCQIQVNGVAAPGTTFSYSGFGAQAGADPVSYTAPLGDAVILCQRVVYADGTDTGWDCLGVDHCFVVGGCFPPAVQTLLDLVNGIVDNAFTSVIDPTVCPVLVANAGAYGPVTIASDGDVYVFDPEGLGLSPIYDCPPYGNF